MTIPDCPHCNANDTLVPVEGQGHGGVEYECSCCSAVVLVTADGKIVQRKRKEFDVSGHEVTDE